MIMNLKYLINDNTKVAIHLMATIHYKPTILIQTLKICRSLVHNASVDTLKAKIDMKLLHIQHLNPRELRF